MNKEKKQHVLRLLDLVLASIGFVMLMPLMVIIFVLGLLDTGSPLILQTRVGRNQKVFTLIKFRTMRKDTVHVASHLVCNTAITPLGSYLRRAKLDELPQLLNVLCGQMSLVGPRPSLPNQHELIRARIKHGVLFARPGITGLAQVNCIDMSTPELLAEIDAQMLREMTVFKYWKYIFMTVCGKGGGDRVKSKQEIGVK
jgi:O-antigen biosynthesis protein WbqP